MFRCIKFGCIAIGKDVKKEEALMRVGGGGLIPNSMICRHCHSDMEEIVDPSDKDGFMGDMFGLHEGKMVEKCIEAGKILDAQPLPDEYMSDVLEWTRVRDGIDDAVIALKGYCDELGASAISDKVQYLYRKLQDIAYTKFNMGD